MYLTIFMKLGTKSFYHYFLDEESFQIVVIYYQGNSYILMFIAAVLADGVRITQQMALLNE